MQTTQKSASIENCFPLLSVMDGCIISKRGDITLGYELSLPPMYSQTEAGYDEMLSALSSAIKVLPEWTLVHRQDRYTYEKYTPEQANGFLAQSYEGHFAGRQFLRHRSYLFLTFSSRGSALKPVGSSGVFGIKNFSKMPSREAVTSAYQAASDFMSVLVSGGRFKARALSDCDLLGLDTCPGLIDTYMTMGREDFLLSDIELSSDSVKMGESVLLGFSISETDPLPGTLSSTQRIDSLSSSVSELRLSFGAQIGSQLGCNHIVNHYILTVNQTAVMQDLDRKRRRMTSMSRNAENRIGAEEIQKYMDAVQTDSLTSVRSHLNVLVWGEDRTALKGKVSAALSTLGISGVQNTCDTPVLWYAGIPGAGCEIGDDNLMLMELRSAVALGIYEGFEEGIPGGKIKLCDRFRHVPVKLDIQEKAMEKGFIGNMNALIMGGSGTGKSFTTNTILHDLYEKGESIFIIDVGDSYQGLCSLIHEESGGKDGFYNSWDRDHPLSFSPFQGWKKWLDGSGNLNQDNNSVNFILSFLRTLWAPSGGWTPQAITILTEILTDFLRAKISSNKTNLVMDDFYDFLTSKVVTEIVKENYSVGNLMVGTDRFDIISFGLALQPYTKNGCYSFLLNSENPADLFNSRFTVFEVDQLSQADPKFYSLCILCIMNAFDVKMRGLQGTKVMVIEEAWKAIANETMAPYLAGLWKTARKFRTSAVVVTQQISDIMSSSIIRDTILKNSDIKILLDQSASQNRFTEIGDLLGLSPHDRDLVLSINRANDPSLRYKEVFITLGDKYSGVYAVEVSPQQALAFESDKQKKGPMLKLAQQTGSYIKAIREITLQESL